MDLEPGRCSGPVSERAGISHPRDLQGTGAVSVAPQVSYGRVLRTDPLLMLFLLAKGTLVRAQVASRDLSLEVVGGLKQPKAVFSFLASYPNWPPP